MALLTSMGLILAAFSLYPPNPAVIALISMPMSLFQFSSASLDGVATALSVFAAAVFLRIASLRGQTAKWLYYMLAIAVVLLAGSRANLLPLLALVWGACFFMKGRKNYLILLGTCLAVFSWLMLAMKTTVDNRIGMTEPPSRLIAFYFQNPGNFFEILGDTLSDQNLVTFYKQSFLGILGWLDASFKNHVYDDLTAGLAILGALSLSFSRIKSEWFHRLLLVSAAMVSGLLIFCAMLVTWSPHPAKIISGVQGRYFLIPAILLAHGLSDSQSFRSGWRRNLGLFLCLVFFIYSVVRTVNLLLIRYYISSSH
jgi:uncharacterized membrane protein